MTTYEQKHALFRDYLEELDTFRDKAVLWNKEENEAYCDECISSPKCSWNNIYDRDGEMAGFLIIGKEGIMKHPDSDYSILEAYIAPHRRGKGLMEEAVKTYVLTHPGIYSLLVIRGNKNALSFWQTLFKKIGGRPYVLSTEYVDPNDKDLILLGYKAGEDKA